MWYKFDLIQKATIWYLTLLVCYYTIQYDTTRFSSFLLIPGQLCSESGPTVNSGKIITSLAYLLFYVFLFHTHTSCLSCPVASIHLNHSLLHRIFWSLHQFLLLVLFLLILRQCEPQLAPTPQSLWTWPCMLNQVHEPWRLNSRNLNLEMMSSCEYSRCIINNWIKMCSGRNWAFLKLVSIHNVFFFAGTGNLPKWSRLSD